MSDQEWMESFAKKNGYQEPKMLPRDRYAAVLRRGFNSTLIVAEVGNEYTYLDYWCYTSTLAAVAALKVWDGEGEPVGWFRHAVTGRRVAREPGEYDDLGNLIPVGQSYVRR